MDTTTDYDELVKWALLPQQQVHRVEKGGATCVWREGIIEAIFAAGKLEEESYPYLLSYLDNGRAAHGLGEEYEFVPPVVPYAKKGIYYVVVEMPSVEKIFALVEDLNMYTDGRRRSDRPEMQVRFSVVLMRLMQQLYADTGSHKIDPAIHAFLREQITPAMEAAGWTVGAGKTFYQPLKMDLESTRNMNRYLVGDTLDPRQFNEYVAMDVYDYSYYLPDEYFPETFIAHRDAMAEKYGYVLEHGRYIPKPVDLPEDIEGIGQVILSNPTNIIRSVMGKRVISLDKIADLLRSMNITLTNQQIKDQLMGNHGDWKKPLILNGFDTRVQHFYPRDFPDIDHDSHNSFPGVAKTRINTNGGRDLDRKVDFAHGFPILINAASIDDNSGELVYLDMVGTRNSVKANWAALMQVKYFSYLRIRFKIGTSQNHIVYQQYLPSGQYQMIMVNKAAVPAHINPTVGIVYLINNEPTDKMPDTFGPTLDKMLEVPVLPEWYEYLWVVGRTTGLVDHAGNPNKMVGVTCWKIRNTDNWNELISTAVAAKELSICYT